MSERARAAADLELCQHEIERLRAREQQYKAKIRRLQREARELRRLLVAALSRRRKT